MKLVEFRSDSYLGFESATQVKDEYSGRIICIRGTHNKEKKISFVVPLTMDELIKITEFLKK